MRTLTTISRGSLFLRLFLWGWEVNPEKLNICKLFWGTLLFPVAFLQSKKVYRFIPRVTFFYMTGAVLFAVLGLWWEAIIWFALGLDSLWVASSPCGEARVRLRGEKRKNELFQRPLGSDRLLESGSSTRSVWSLTSPTMWRIREQVSA